MTGKSRRLKLSGWLMLLLLCFIWGNSLLPGTVSGRLSDWVKDILAFLLPGEVPGITSGGGLLRKVAHFTEFAALGAVLVWRFGVLEKRKILALACGIGVACVDEIIQVFVPGRGPGFRDVAIDTCGFLTGMGLLLLAQTFTKTKSKENESL